MVFLFLVSWTKPPTAGEKAVRSNRPNQTFNIAGANQYGLTGTWSGDRPVANRPLRPLSLIMRNVLNLVDNYAQKVMLVTMVFVR